MTERESYPLEVLLTAIDHHIDICLPLELKPPEFKARIQARLAARDENDVTMRSRLLGSQLRAFLSGGEIRV